MSRITINSNPAALNTQRRLEQSTQSLRDSFKRLSSGLRINSASDDAAGLAIVAALKVDRRVYAQGVRNLNDGISFLNVAEAAVSELTGILIRVRELSTQSANGTLSPKQRVALDEEAQALTREYNRIINTTEFNGINVLKAEEVVLQTGYAEGGKLRANLVASVVRTTGDGTFQTEQAYAVGTLPFAVQAADFNGDGAVDLVTSNRTSNDLSVLLGNGDGSFQTQQTFATGANPQGVQTADFNGDGVLDLVAVNLNSNNLSVLLGNGDGSFQTQQTFATGTGPQGVQTADLNGDGVLDIVTANLTSNNLSVLLGNGDGSFQTQQTFAVGTSPGNVHAADFNGDGAVDLVSSNAVSGNLSVLLGNGDGSFQTQQTYAVGSSPRSVESADFNEDGVLDLVASNLGSNNLSVLLGNGDGSFQTQQTYAVGTSPRLVQVADFNGDGVLDLVAANRDSNNLGVLLGNGDGSFQTQQTFAAGTLPTNVHVADFNGDGAMDLVATNQSTNEISVLLGNSITSPQNVRIKTLSGISVASRLSALETQDTIDTYLEEVTLVAGVYGAATSRIEAAARTLAATSENVQAAESRILDADIAEEAANLVKNRILQQAGAAVLAQANQLPALALRLLET